MVRVSCFDPHQSLTTHCHSAPSPQKGVWFHIQRVPFALHSRHGSHANPQSNRCPTFRTRLALPMPTGKFLKSCRSSEENSPAAVAQAWSFSEWYRRVLVTLRLLASEEDQIEAAARAAGKSKSEWVREVLLEAAREVKPWPKPTLKSDLIPRGWIPRLTRSRRLRTRRRLSDPTNYGAVECIRV